MFRRHTRVARRWQMSAALGAVAVAATVGARLQFGEVELHAQPTAAESTSSSLSFAIPSTTALRASKKKVFAHYMPSLPVSFDNKAPESDTYAVQYLAPEGENGKHVAYGGFLRDRPLGRAVRTEQSWALADAEAEIRQAQSEGIDGFTIDMLQLPGDARASVWTHTLRMMKAAENVGDFDIVLMPDMSASKASQDPATLAKYIAQLGEYSSAYRLADGRLVVSPFVADRQPVAFWASFNSIMADTYHQPVALVPLFLNEMPVSKTYAPVSYGMANWGARTPELNNPAATNGSSQLGRVAQVHKLGKIWMQPVSVQDVRPRSGSYEEAQNTQNLRNTWEIAIKSDSEWVQLATWNDYTEGTHMAPSERSGWSFLDINAYYLTWFKTGKAPAVTNDAVYLTHRNQFAGDAPSFPQTRMMALRSGRARNTVEALTFLTKPGTVNVTVGSKTTSCDAPAGVGVCTVDLAAGNVSAKVVRGAAVVAAVVSQTKVSRNPFVQDMEYTAASSRRAGTAGPVGPIAPAATHAPKAPATTAPAAQTQTQTEAPKAPATEAPEAPKAPKAPATTAPAQADPTTVVVSPSADTYANEGAPNKNFGSDASLSSRGTIGAESFLKFKLPTAPAGTKLTGATLKLRTTTAAVAGSAETHSVSLAASSWAEGTVTWNDRPATADQVGTVPAVGSDTSVSVDLDVTAIAGSLGGVRSLAVTNDGKDSLWFWSSDFKGAGQRPQLVLTFG